MGKPHQIPGWWTAKQAREEVEKQTGIPMSADKWKRYRSIGIIEEGVGRHVNRKGEASLLQLWSDAQLFLSVIPAIRRHEATKREQAGERSGLDERPQP